MGRAEAKVEKYLHDQVTKLGGTTYKWTGSPGVPDRIVMLYGQVWFVEVKTLDGKLQPHQQREITRIRSQGHKTYVVYGIAYVDRFIESIKC